MLAPFSWPFNTFAPCTTPAPPHAAPAPAPGTWQRWRSRARCHSLTPAACACTPPSGGIKSLSSILCSAGRTARCVGLIGAGHGWLGLWCRAETTSWRACLGCSAACVLVIAAAPRRVSRAAWLLARLPQAAVFDEVWPLIRWRVGLGAGEAADGQVQDHLLQLRQRKRRQRPPFQRADAPQQNWRRPSPCRRSCADGYNVCLLAYGQTGSG